MQRNRKSATRRTVALTLGAGVLSSLALAGPALSAAPAAGTNCVAADGKINGRGATFQTNAQVCGPVATDTGAATGMINYNGATLNGPAAGSYPTLAGNGSGNGLRALNCRTDAFVGSDVPYTNSDLTGKTTGPFTPLAGLRSAVLPPATSTYTAAGQAEPTAPNNLVGSDGTPCNQQQGNVGPYPPNSGPYPNAADAAGGNNRPISFPIAGGAVAIGVRLDPGVNGCPNPIPDINLSSSQASRLFGGTTGGTITNWSQLIPGCNVPVTRVVRLDSSGTTNVFKSYLRNSSPTDPLCDPTPPAGVGANSWTSPGYFDVNTAWPDDPACSPLVRGAVAGGAAVVTAVSGTNGAVGYADMSDWVAFTAVHLANVNNPSGSPIAPGTIVGSSVTSACNLGTLAAPAGGNASAISQSVNPLQSWSSNGNTFPSGRSFQDVTFAGDGYPICGITFIATWANESGAAGTGPISRLTANQRRTLYSYLIYLTSPAAQARLSAAGFNPIRQSLLNSVRAGLQAPVSGTGGF
jgi:ABC-type phosphate transport system substrate-binding protein